MTPIEIQMDNEFPNNKFFQHHGHGMDVEDIPESWFVKKGLSNGGMNESVISEAIEDKNLKVMATKAANRYAKNGLTAAEQISKDVMPTDRIVIPVKRFHGENPEIIKYLADRGYSVHGEYKGGLAAHESKPDRPLRIGRILSVTGAPQELQQAWERDPARRGVTSAPETSIVISRHPYDVAAMSSGQHWESCQTLPQKNVLSMSSDPERNGKPQEAGIHSAMVPDIIASGAHIAYQVKNPNDVDEHYKPIGRHILNVYTADNGERILRPSDHYGHKWEDFTRTINDWAEKTFPATQPVYIRHPEAYPEGKSRIYNFSPELNEHWKNSLDSESAYRNPNHEVLQHYVDTFKKNPKGGYPISVGALMQNPHLTNSMQDSLFNSVKDAGYQPYMMKAAEFAPERHIDTLLNLKKNPLNHDGIESLAKNQNANSEHLHTMLDYYGAGPTAVPGVRKLSTNHPQKSIKILTAITNNKNADDSHFSKMLELEDFHNLDTQKASENIAEYSDMMKNIASRYRSEAVGRRLAEVLPKSSGNQVANETAPIIRDIAAKHPHLITKDFDDNQIAGAINRANFTDENSHKNLVNIGLSRNSEKTLRAIASNTKDHNLLNRLVNHENPMVSRSAQINLMHSGENS